MFGISAGFESKIVWPSPLFALRSFIKSMAESVLWRPGGGGRGGGGGGGGGGGREPEGGGGAGGAAEAAAAVKETDFYCYSGYVHFCCHLVEDALYYRGNIKPSTLIKEVK